MGIYTYKRWHPKRCKCHLAPSSRSKIVLPKGTVHTQICRLIQALKDESPENPSPMDE